MRAIFENAAILLVLLATASCTAHPSLSKPAPEEEARPVEALNNRKFQDGIRQAGVWAGGPGFKFEGVGRNTLATAIEHGLNPDHKVLDIGAGSLRVGWWLLHYIEPRNYYAIEPVKNRIDTAARMIDAEINIYYNSDWEFPPVEFDFVIARSIWTHASKWMISKMLSEFAENSAPNAKFLTSVLLASDAQEDYQGSDWVGRVEQSDTPGTIRHLPSWMKQECEKHGLTFEIGEEQYGQTWVLITNTPPGSGESTREADSSR